mgnify:CR=1 FL=1
MHETVPERARVFDRRLVRARRDRWAAGLGQHDFLFREVADRLADRLVDVTRRFPLALAQLRSPALVQSLLLALRLAWSLFLGLAQGQRGQELPHIRRSF